MLSYLALDFVLTSDHAFDKSNIVTVWSEPIWPKGGPLSQEKVHAIAKKNKLLETERFTFGLESSRVEATISELELKNETTEIQQMETDVNSMIR